MAAIVHNSGVNYTLYYNVLNYFKTIMNNHPSIEIVTQGLIQDFDTREFPQYPVGNVSILSSNFVGTTTEWEIQLVVADKIKNKSNETPSFNTQTIPFYGVDDTVDIHANTLAIINDLTSYTARSVDGFEILDNVLCEPFEDRFNNGLAGWVATFTLTVHNDRNRCLFFLIAPEGSGYKLEDCGTSEIKYAVVSGSVSVGNYFSANIGNSTNCFYVSESVSDFDSWDYVNLKPLDFYGSCVDCQFGPQPTTTTTLAPTTTTTAGPTTTTTLAPTTTTQAPTTTSTTLQPTTTTTSSPYNYITVAGRSPVSNATVTYQTYDEPGIDKTVNLLGYDSFTFCGTYVTSSVVVERYTGRMCPFNDPAPSNDCTNVTFTNNTTGTILIAHYYPCNSSTYTTLTVNPLQNSTVCASYLDLIEFNSSVNRLLTTGSSC